MKWIFTCLQVSWLQGEGNNEILWERFILPSISRQAESRKSLQSSEKAWSPKTARSKGARNSWRSEPCLFQILKRGGGGHRILSWLCLPRTKIILKYYAIQEWHTLFWCGLHFSIALIILHNWYVNWDMQMCFPKLTEFPFYKRCFWKKV